MTITYEEVIALIGGEASPCGFCGGPDHRHRVADAVLDCIAAGDDETRVLEDFGLLPKGTSCLE